MKRFYLFLLFIASISFSMDSHSQYLKAEYQKLSLEKAKIEIERNIRAHDADKVKMLLELFGNKLSQQEKDSYFFDCYRSPRLVSCFLDIGADVNIHYDCKQSQHSELSNPCTQENMLHMAADVKNYDLIKILLKYNPLINALDNQQETPLMKACAQRVYTMTQGGHKKYIPLSIDLILDLIEAGANRSLTNESGKTALQIAQTEIVDLEQRQIIVELLTCKKTK